MEDSQAEFTAALKSGFCSKEPEEAALGLDADAGKKQMSDKFNAMGQ